MSVEFVDDPQGADEERQYRKYMDSLFRRIEAPRVCPQRDNERVMHIAHPWHGVDIGQASPDIVNAVIGEDGVVEIDTEDIPIEARPSRGKQLKGSGIVSVRSVVALKYRSEFPDGNVQMRL